MNLKEYLRWIFTRWYYWVLFIFLGLIYLNNYEKPDYSFVLGTSYKLGILFGNIIATGILIIIIERIIYFFSSKFSIR
jgi:hypothetical protein